MRTLIIAAALVIATPCTAADEMAAVRQEIAAVRDELAVARRLDELGARLDRLETAPRSGLRAV